jgi:hypothetical protein
MWYRPEDNHDGGEANLSEVGSMICQRQHQDALYLLHNKNPCVGNKCKASPEVIVKRVVAFARVSYNTSSGQQPRDLHEYSSCRQLVHQCMDWQSGQVLHPSDRPHAMNPLTPPIWHHSPQTLGKAKTVGRVEDAESPHTKVPS